MNDWIRSSTNGVYHKPANGDTAGNVETVCKRTITARFIADQDSVFAMDEAGYAYVCKDCQAKQDDNMSEQQGFLLNLDTAEEAACPMCEAISRPMFPMQEYTCGNCGHTWQPATHATTQPLFEMEEIQS